ncbi:MAG TPA: cobyric acid synthase CobQ, partial [Pseudonocardiaceae bacterium]
LDAEDSLSYPANGAIGRPAPPVGDQWLRVGVVRLPRMSNATDVEALAVEPGVSVRLVSEPAGIADVDLVVLPGSKATVADMAWLRETGLADAVEKHHRNGRPVLGICGGFQMLANTLVDHVESGAGEVAGLGLLDVDIEFAADKTLGNPTGVAFGVPASGYEIHHGRISHRAADLPPMIITDDGAPEGVLAGSIAATHWHGLLETDAVRRSLLAWAADVAARTGFRVAPDVSFAQTRAAQLDLLGDLVADHLDTAEIWRLLRHGVRSDRPTIGPFVN